LQRSNDHAGCGHVSKFKPLVLAEIQAVDDIMPISAAKPAWEAVNAVKEAA
jgi:hypothetical protein